ncbi:MAG: Rid family detoxifying hydrolase [Angelakisella sp.]
MQKEKITVSNAPAAIGPYSQAIFVEGYLYVSGQLPIDAATGQMGETIQQQTANCLQNIAAILKSKGMTMADVIKTTVFMTDLALFTDMNGVYETFFTDPYPARSTVQVAKLPKDASVEIECIAKKE